MWSPSASAFEVGLPDLGRAKQVLAGAGHGDDAAHHDIAAMGELQGMEGILLDEEHGHALAVELGQHLEDLLDDEGARPSEGSSSSNSCGPGR